MLRTLVRAEITAMPADQVRVVMSTDSLARDGHVLLPRGCQLQAYRANPIVLWSHDPEMPVGNAGDIVVGTGGISCTVTFAPPGVDPTADRIRGLTKAGVIRAVSVGFDPIEMEPLDPKHPRGGQRISIWEMLELSFVSVPADTGAIVTARQARAGKVLSGENAQALREAHDLVEAGRAKIAHVLDAASGGASDGDGDDAERRARRRRQVEVLSLQQKAGPQLEAYLHRQRQVEVLSLSHAPDLASPKSFAQRQRELASLSRRRS